MSRSRLKIASQIEKGRLWFPQSDVEVEGSAVQDESILVLDPNQNACLIEALVL